MTNFLNQIKLIMIRVVPGSGEFLNFIAGIDQTLCSIIKALAALRAVAESFINGISIAAAAACRAAQVRLPNGIADADIHQKAFSRITLKTDND